MNHARGTMSGRERFEAVFRGEIPDRVPVTLFIQDQGHFVNQLHPEIDPWDSLSLQLRIVEFQRAMGVDIMARLLFGTLDVFQWLIFGGVDTSRSTDDWQGRRPNGETAARRFARRSSARRRGNCARSSPSTRSARAR